MDQLVEHRVNQIKKETGKIFSVLKNPGGALNTVKENDGDMLIFMTYFSINSSQQIMNHFTIILS